MLKPLNPRIIQIATRKASEEEEGSGRKKAVTSPSFVFLLLHHNLQLQFTAQRSKKLCRAPQMFYLSRIEHTLRLPPHLLSLRLEDAVKGELEKIFLDKVIAKLGLCISVHSIQSIKDGFILPNDGHPTFRVEFTLIMFRPFVGEIISAKLKESTSNGLRLSLGFFDDIYVPVHLLPSPSCSEPDPEKRNNVIWIWKCPDADDLAVEWTDEIRFQVQSVTYPPIPIEQPEDAKPFAPMVVTGSIDYDGLGPLRWWDNAEDKDEEPEDP
ncbi:unnamed protein product [Malus baccata var. baccata]